LTVETADGIAATAGAGRLVVGIDAPLPAALAVGSGTALFVAGTCFAPADRIASLALLVDGDEQPVMAHSMPRLDLLRERGAPASYRSGFWGIARVAARGDAATPVDLRLRARLEGGGTAEAGLARVPIAAAEAPAVAMEEASARPSEDADGAAEDGSGGAPVADAAGAPAASEAAEAAEAESVDEG
jgi:hypothetical protein